MRPVLLLLLAGALFAQTPKEAKFRVHKLDSSQVAKIAAADKALESALETFRSTTAALAIAQKAKETAEFEAKQAQNGELQGNCVYPPYSSGLISSYSGYRDFRKIEIRGEYLLISEGTESCSAGWGALTTTSWPSTSTTIAR